MDSSTQLWSVVFNEGEKYDKVLAESWKGNMDGILFFVRSFTPSISCHGIELKTFGRRAFFLQLLQPLS